MHRLSGRSVRNIFALALVTWVLFMGPHPVAEAASMLTFEQPVHFLASDGTDVLVGIGTHEVDTLVGSRLRLNIEEGETVFLDAMASTHSEEIEAPLAVTVSGEDPDVVHIVLLLPNGQALDAPGSISGTRPRDIAMMLATSSQIQFAVMQTGSFAQPAPNVGVSGAMGAIGPLAGKAELPRPQYSAPTASLTMVANAIKLQYKSLNTVLAVPAGLRLPTPVEITVEYLSPVSPRQVMTQKYVAETGNRFVRQDLVGDGKPRRQFMNITLIERTATGAGVQFTMNWQIDLDPLYNVQIGKLQFKLIDDCDRFRNSEIKVGWMFPDKGTGIRQFSTRAGRSVDIAEFQWSRAKVSAKHNLIQPHAKFIESDFSPTMDWLFGLEGRIGFEQNQPPLIPGTSGVVTEVKKPNGQSCRAEFKYLVRNQLYVDPLMIQPTPPAPSLQPITVDNRDPSVQRFGEWFFVPPQAVSGPDGLPIINSPVYGGDSEFSGTATPLKRFRWTPTIPTAGQYDVFVWWPNDLNRSATVPYTVHHASGNTVKTFNQRTGGNTWVLHGRYALAAGTTNYVEVSNANGIAGADAVQFRRVP